MKTITRRLKLTFLAALLIFAFAIPVHAAVSAPVTLKAKKYHENGLWTRKIAGVTWYFDINDYTSEDNPAVYGYGVVYVYRGKSNYLKRKYQASGLYFKTGTNSYYMKYSGGRINFTVGKSYVTLKHVSGKITNRKLNGKFKLVKRHYS